MTPAGKTLTKQLMVAVESALQDKFGSHAGWAHNTLFISELASQRHVLPAHLHPGARGRAPKKTSAPDEGSVDDMAGPVTPPQKFGRGQRIAGRSAGTKRRTVEAEPDTQKASEQSDAINDSSQSQPATPPGVEKAAARSAAKAASRRGSRVKHELQDEGVVLKTEAVHSSAIVSEFIEEAAIEAFADVRQVGVQNF